MSYFDAYRFVFRRPDWFKNALLLVVCMIIPVIGPLALMGYLRSVFLDILERPEGEYSAFSFDLFGAYIGWGVWPFLASLILMLAVLPIAIGGAVGFFVLMATHPKPGVLIAYGASWYVVYIGSILLLSVVSFPVTLRAMLMQDFKSAFNWSFIKDFLGKMWLDMLLKQLFMMVTGLAIILAGMICCVVGMYPASAVVMLAGWYLQVQIYKDYVARGGIEIPIKPLDGPGPVRAFEVGPGPGI